MEQYDRSSGLLRRQIGKALSGSLPRDVTLADASPSARIPRTHGQFMSSPHARLNVQLSGTRRHGVSIAGRWLDHEMRSGHALYWAPNAWWAQYPPGDEELLGLVFRADTLRVIWSQLARDGQSTVHAYHTAQPVGTEVRGVIDALNELTERGRNSSATRALVRALMMLSLEHLAADENAPRGTKAQQTWRRVYQFLTEHYAEPLTRDLVGKAVGLNPNYLSELCSKAHGRSFQQTLEDIRLQHARRLLRETDLKIAAIAMACGYPNGAYFTNVFRRRMGAAPGAWRRLGH